ncbi:hypothetical protein DSO57_1025165 [Entomophthora muscae]|uniref:Uncharacterized protein n=1 Tax=Entomophthora muscae TaxID=34485 RepID=A0ACC2T2P2_9FUNG|nr:hypothetical protein DSO57_1025165 [Entomophthora muscae]
MDQAELPLQNKEELSPTETMDPSLSHVTLLLVSGKRATFHFPSTSTIIELKHHVLDNWPEDWATDKPNSVYGLKFVHLGKFLEENLTLKEAKIPEGQQTVIHLKHQKGRSIRWF